MRNTVSKIFWEDCHIDNTTKRCSKCGETKGVSEFHKNKNSKDGFAHWCKDCCSKNLKRYYKNNRDKLLNRQKCYRESHSEYYKEYMREYREEHKEEISTAKKTWYIQNKEYVCEKSMDGHRRKCTFIDSLKTPCEKCGETRLYVLDFHHINHAEKSFSIGAHKHKSDEDILNESKKCVCLCRNCHQEFHHFYGKQPENPVECLEEYLGRKLT